MTTGEIHFIAGEHGGRFPDGNCLFVDDELPIVVDPATRRSDLESIHARKKVRLVVNTHYHVDHIRYNVVFDGADLAAHPADAPAIESIDGMVRMVGVEDKPWLGLWKSVMQNDWGYHGREVTRPVEDGDEIILGANTLRFVHAPGHTPGNMCLHFLEKEAVYLADIDLTAFGPWYGNRYSDIDAFLRSIERVKSISARTWYTAHGDGVIEGDITDRLDAFAAVIDVRDARILEFISRPRRFADIVAAALVYGKRWDPAEMFEYFEGTMLEKHLSRMESDGRARREGDLWTAV